MQNKIVSALKKDHIVKDKKKRIKVLLKVIESIYDKNPEMQDEIDASMVEVAPEEGVSPELVFFYFAFFVVLFIMAILEKNLSKSVEDKHCVKNQLLEILRIT